MQVHLSNWCRINLDRFSAVPVLIEARASAWSPCFCDRFDAGAPRKLVPLSEDEHLFKSLSASNQAPAASGGEEEERNARAARRLVEQTFRFTASDSKGNLAGQIK